MSALSEFYGTFLHLKANYEFESEINSKTNLWQLLIDSFFGALSELALGNMILFSLIGYTHLLMIKKSNEEIS